MASRKKKKYKSGSAALFTILALSFQYKIIPRQYTHCLVHPRKKIKKKEVWSPEGFMLQCKAAAGISWLAGVRGGSWDIPETPTVSKWRLGLSCGHYQKLFGYSNKALRRICTLLDGLPCWLLSCTWAFSSRRKTENLSKLLLTERCSMRLECCCALFARSHCKWQHFACK